MSTNQNTNKNNNKEPSFDENRAYEELRMIFVIAIETQDFTTLEARIAAWEKRYPLAEFTDENIIRKIKAILNKDFLSRLIGDYLAAKILHEQEKQKEFYDSLKSIIDTAKKNKDYKTAQKEIRKWKNNLHENGFNLYSFDRLYRARICTLLLLPSRELDNQEQATDELKKLKEAGSSMNSDEYFAAISNWQNTYSISDFPDKLQKELNAITTEVFDSISQKRTSEQAISEIEKVLSLKDNPLPVDSIASILSKYDYNRFEPDALSRIQILSMEALSIQESTLDNGIPDIDLSMLAAVSPTEKQALTSLRDILNKTPHDMDTILNWIYVNRKITYSEFARETIVKYFSSVGYIVPNQSTYAIPEINPTLDYQDFSKIDDIRKSVILNYIGIISQGDKLSIEGKDNLIEAHAVSAEEALVQEEAKPIMFLDAFDTIEEQPEVEEGKLYAETGALEVDKEEESIYNIFIEDIIDDPLATYSIQTSSIDNKKLTPYNTDLEQSSLEEPTKIPSKDDDKTVSLEPTVSDSLIVTNNINEELVPEPTTSSTNTDSEYSLTIQDEENLGQAYDLSTYVVVASPILAQALAPKKERSRKKTKELERIKD